MEEQETMMPSDAKLSTEHPENEKELKSKKRKIVNKAEFKRKLKRLLLLPYDPILEILELKPKKKGPRETWTKDKRNQYIDEMVDLAEAITIKKMAKTKFDEIVIGRKPHEHPIAGHGREEKRKNVKLWAQKEIEEDYQIVYSFWKGKKKCLYVGKGDGIGRFLSYDAKSIYGLNPDRVKIWRIKNWRELHSAECLAMHLHNPSENKNKSKKERNQTECPICERKEIINEQIRDLLGMGVRASRKT